MARRRRHVDVDADALLAKLRAFEGSPSGSPMEARDEVNQAMIRHWIDAMGDDNPVYVDGDVARDNGFPGVVAPPTMLQAWIMRGYRAPGVTDEPGGQSGGSGASGTSGASAQEQLFALFDEAGLHLGRGDELRAGVRPPHRPR